MMHIEQHGPVLAIRMSRSFFGRPFWWTTAYWVDGILIDTGPRFAVGGLLQALSKVEVNHIVLTHSHADQIGGLAQVHERYPTAAIYAARQALPAIREPKVEQIPLYSRLIWGRPQPCTAVHSLDEVNNMICGRQYTLRVIETPGHAPDHIALFEPHHRWLFSGDVFVHGQDEAWVAEADLFGVVSSLRTLATLHPERLFPSDGYISRTPLPELHGKISALVHLAHEVARLDALGFSTAEMVVQLLHKEPPIHFWTMGHYSAAKLINACRSYNAIFSPFANGAAAPSTAQNTTQTTDPDDASDDSSNDSSTNWPIDWEDLIR
ncbi:MAG: MBL fold metallo-hydrolase [Caldilineaceae bacterium]